MQLMLTSVQRSCFASNAAQFTQALSIIAYQAFVCRPAHIEGIRSSKSEMNLKTESNSE